MYELTPREFANYAKGRVNIMRAQERMEWERTRWLGFISFKAAGAKIRSPKDLMLLDHERPTDEDKSKRLEAIKRKFPKQIDG